MTHRHQQAFTLIEMAIVIAIISVVILFGIDIGRNALEGSERLETQQKLAIIQKALDQYAARNGYLPCPADPSFIPSDSNFGMESRSNTAGLGCVTTANVVIPHGGDARIYMGMVPVRNLELTDNYAADAWANKFSYAVSDLHVGASSTGMKSYGENPGVISMRTGQLSGGSNLTVSSLQDGIPGAGATYVVISHGRDGVGAYPLNGTAVVTACPSTATFTDHENCDRGSTGDAVFYDSIYNDAAPGTGVDSAIFDDLVVWGSNEGQRETTNASMDVGPLLTTCTTGCEPWCAQCTENYGSSTTKSRLCSKFIILNSTGTCEAACIWAGENLSCP